MLVSSHLPLWQALALFVATLAATAICVAWHAARRFARVQVVDLQIAERTSAVEAESEREIAGGEKCFVSHFVLKSYFKSVISV